MKTSIWYFHFICILSAILINTNIYAQDPDTSDSVDQRLQIVRNDGGNNGEFHIAFQVKATNPPDANTLGSATIDINYNDTILSYLGFSNWAFGITDGYDRNADNNTDEDGNFIRLSVAATAVGDTVDGELVEGFDVGEEYDSWVILRFQILNENEFANLDIRDGTNTVGFFENYQNEPDNGVIIEQPLSPPETIENISLTAYSLDLIANPPDGGILEGDGTYGQGDSVTIDATSNTGWMFIAWTETTEDGDTVSFEPNFTFTMPDSNVTLVANFEQIDYELITNAFPDGSGTTTGDGIYNFGTEIDMTATPETGWEFTGWTEATEEGDTVSFEPNFTFTMPDSNVTLVANFEQIDYELITNAFPDGSGTTTGDGIYNFGNEIDMTATPETGWEFTGWTESTEEGDTVSFEPNFIFTMPDSNVTLVANFQEIYTLALEASPEEGGIVTDNTNQGPYAEGELVNISATPNEGWLFVNWTQDGTEISTEQTFDYQMPASDVTLVANFEQVVVNVRAFLQGPYNTATGEMNNTLNTGGDLPAEHPYNQDPWNYEGTESVDANFFTENPAIVDWVLLELRTGTGGESEAGTRAAFVTQTGNIVDLDGSSPVLFEGLFDGDYYIVIRHRNHLDIMSANALSLNYNSNVYDFSTGQEQAFGTNSLYEFNDGRFALIGGDGNADGFISSLDFNVFNPANRAAASGYHIADYNMDGDVTALDFNLFNPNNRAARQSNVPD